ncbi:MAG: NAD(P)/FAD-dependent oxidoreductase [Candidatus Margulisiibacteriota bacterium]|nr:NAD(P)/FAD-dependent oxidoreductase [Candidatus Margulisiibacteriota bacterium]
MKKSAAIIGGGITGLTTAYFLLKKGIKATIFERQEQLGGLAAGFKFENSYLEKFYHHFFSQDKQAVQLLSELGISDKLYWAYPKMGFFSGNRIYPFTTPLDLLSFPPLPIADRIKLGLFSIKAKRIADWRPLEKISAVDWLTNNLGKRICEKVWSPLLYAKFGEQADEIPASWVWARIIARAKSRSRFGLCEKLGYLKGGYKVLIDALADRVTKMGGEIKLNSRVDAYPVSGFDMTIITAPDLYPGKDIKYAGNICVMVKTRCPVTNYYWTNIGDNNLPFCVMVEQTNAFDDSGYGGYRVVYLSSYVGHEGPEWKMSDQEIYRRYLEGLKTINPEFEDKNLSGYSVFRAKYAQPIPTLGYSKKIPSFHIAKDLFLVSNTQIYPQDRGINASIRLAKWFVSNLA